MEPTIPTPAASSTITSTSVSHPAFRLLELSIISAQDLLPVSKSMRTYAITWVQPNRKLTTRVDPHGNTNPTWNDKFAFRVDDDFLFSDNAAVTVEIYTVSWFRDVLIGTVRVLISNLITPQQFQSGNVRYVALQIRRSSGSPQGILNMGVSLVDSTMRSMPLQTDQLHREDFVNKVNKQNLQDKVEGNEDNDDKQQLISKIHLWRSLSLGSSLTNEDSGMKPGSICNGSIINGSGYNGSVCNGSMVNGSVCNGSMVNGSELCSDIGPSASIVAAEMALRPCPPGAAAAPTKALRPPAPAGESESLILEDLTPEEAVAKGLTTDVSRWRKEVPLKRGDDFTDGHTRRHSDGGLFSCFANAYGYEFTIVCGANNNQKQPVNSKSRKK